ncbi:hypothetical protein IDH44_18440 [Paenibacillus sp. IB182496]|uniref:Uncharacterized protein n=1 Tax=Paenibacillus sabuli TaxID=2772509 RepID=A0A927BUQ5_9BACL|nr:hypothetical protein [Paenibacillus sabuli]MBD2847183.1 hypothetical protein [Paenibacillus sabuli]
MKHYDSSMPTNKPVSQAQGSVKKLHNAVSQALSHPSEQSVEQAEHALAHSEQAVAEARAHSEDGQGVDLVEGVLQEERERLQAAEQALREQE